MKISFCIPFYSNKSMLTAAISSVQRQTLQDWELVVVDDCSPEIGVRELVEGLGDDRIRYRCNEKNLGLAGNWNRCLREAQAPLVTIFHADDVLEPNYAELMVTAHQSYPDAAAYFCRTRIIDSVGKPLFSFPDFIKLWIMPARDEIFQLQGERAVSDLLRGNFIFCPSLCYQRSKIGAESFSTEWKMVLDLDYIFRILFSNGVIIGLPNKAYRYRRHGGSQTHALTQSFVRFEEEAGLYNLVHDLAKKRGWEDAARVALSKNIIKLHILYMSLLDLAHLRLRPLLLKLRLLRTISQVH